MTEAYAFSTVIAVRKGRGAIHLSQQAGTWATAPLFVTTLCGRNINNRDGWVEIAEAATCQRCERENAEIESARAFVIEQDHAAALAEDAEREFQRDRNNPRREAERRAAAGQCVDCADTGRWDDGSLCPTCRTMTPLTFGIGERVGIVRGLQSVKGPQVYMHGIVVRQVTTWNDLTEYLVRAEDGTELLYRAYLLRHAFDEPRELTPDEYEGISVEIHDALVRIVRERDLSVPPHALPGIADAAANALSRHGIH